MRRSGSFVKLSMEEGVNEEEVELSLGLAIGGRRLVRKRCDLLENGDVLKLEERKKQEVRRNERLQKKMKSEEGGGSISRSDCGSFPSQEKFPKCIVQVGADGVKEQVVCSRGANSPNDEKVVELKSISPTPSQNTACKEETQRPVVLPFIPLAKMPCVSTTGSGPGGTTVRGFLYRYTREEVCIVCVCHGLSFSPAKFVEHAGGKDVDNPLRHITVTPFPSIRP